MRYRAAFTVSLVLFLAASLHASAQRGPAPAPPEKPAAAKQKPKAPPVEQATPVPPPGPPPQQVAMPNADKIVLLIRTTLSTLNDAIQTGNFTVLRDKGAPGFRDANSAARLGQIFSDLASRNLDLSVVSVITPQLSETPVLDQAKGRLNIKGYFPTEPQRINFEILFQAVDGHWRLFGLSVRPTQAPPSLPQPSAPTPQALGIAPQGQQ